MMTQRRKKAFAEMRRGEERRGEERRGEERKRYIIRGVQIEGPYFFSCAKHESEII